RGLPSAPSNSGKGQGLAGATFWWNWQNGREANTATLMSRRWMHGLVSGLLALLLLPTARVEADDLLRLRAGGNGQGFVEVTGTITDYTGRQVMVARGGREQGYPADRVIEITTN